MNVQKCPNCTRLNDVSVFVSGQRVACHFCGFRFTVQRSGSEADNAPAPEPLSPEDAEILRQAPRINGFDIYKVIGQGGMGVIYLARQRSLERDVAIKVLSEKWRNQDVILRRFHREAAALANLSHPNIITIIDKGDVDGQPYFAMEFIKGVSLRTVIERGPLAGKDFISYMMQICRGLSHAHRANVVHRDLKPENILIDGYGNVKLADFGLAALVDPELGSDNMTKSRVAMGTFNYMAPEQRQNAKTVDARADIYSLGVVMYEMLTKQLPVGAYRPPSEMHSTADDRFDHIVTRCLAANPELRYATVDEVMAALQEAAEPKPAPVERTVSNVRRTSVVASLQQGNRAGAAARRRREQGYPFLQGRARQNALIGVAGASLVCSLILALVLAFTGGAADPATTVAGAGAAASEGTAADAAKVDAAGGAKSGARGETKPDVKSAEKRSGETGTKTANDAVPKPTGSLSPAKTVSNGGALPPAANETPTLASATRAAAVTPPARAKPARVEAPDTRTPVERLRALSARAKESGAAASKR